MVERPRTSVQVNYHVSFRWGFTLPFRRPPPRPATTRTNFFFLYNGFRSSPLSLCVCGGFSHAPLTQSSLVLLLLLLNRTRRRRKRRNFTPLKTGGGEPKHFQIIIKTKDEAFHRLANVVLDSVPLYCCSAV